MKQIWWMVTVAACGGGGASMSTDAGSGSGSDLDAAPKTTVKLRASGSTPVALAAFRDGAGPWQTMTAASGSYTIQVTADYEWIVVCGGDTDRTIALGGAVVSDGQQSAFCFADNTPPATVAVTGTMAQPGTVEMADSDTGTSANWAFSVDSETGTQDLFAFDGSKLAIRRNVTVAAAMDVGAIDLATDGTSFAPHLVTVGNLGNDALSTVLTLFTAHGTATIVGNVPTLHEPAPAQLAANDSYFVDIYGIGANTTRMATSFGSVADSYPLPDALAGVTFSGTTAMFDTLPAGFVAVQVSTTTAHGTARFEVTPDWITLRGTAVELALDTTGVPGFDASWLPAPTAAQTLELLVDFDSGAVFQSSRFAQDVAGGAPKAAKMKQRARDRKAQAAQAAHRDLR